MILLVVSYGRKTIIFYEKNLSSLKGLFEKENIIHIYKKFETEKYFFK